MTLTPSEKEEFLSRLTELIENNLSDERFGVNELAMGMGMSRSNLHRKLKATKGVSISSFIRQVRLDKAMVSLKQSSSTISEIAFEVGFNSVTYFIKSFHDHYGFPPGEVRKGEFPDTTSVELQPLQKRAWFMSKRGSLTLFVSIIAILMTALILIIIFKPFGTRDQALDKSIAVLPFINDSPDDKNRYFINGTMEAILDNLSKIEDLRVISRTSTEQYRNNPKPVPEIAEETNVSYVVEGSGQMEGDRIRLSIQLIDAINDQHLWSGTFNRSVDEIFELQSEIAQLVAGEIKAIITPGEKAVIEIIPTESRTAYDLYLKAKEVLNNSFERESFERAIYLCHLALEYDSSFASPYMWIAWLYLALYQRNPLEYVSYLDSTIYYVNLAISLDPSMEQAYQTRGRYYRSLGLSDRALKDYDRATELNPNFVWAYSEKGWVYYDKFDPINSIDNFSKCLQLTRGPELPQLLYNLGMVYLHYGFPEKFKELLLEKIALDRDTMAFYRNYSYADLYAGNYREAIDTAMRAYSLDSTDLHVLRRLGKGHYYLRQFKESSLYFNKYVSLMEEQDQFILDDLATIIYVFKQTGNEERAKSYTKKLMDYIEIRKEEALGSIARKWISRIDLINGDKGPMIDLLSELARQQDSSYIMVSQYQVEPLYDRIRNDPEFIRLTEEMMKKYTAQHERVRQWLEENEMQ